MSYPPRRPTTKDKDRISLSASKDRAGYYFSNLKPRTIHEAGRNITIKDMNWSPPGTRIACALSDKLVRVWNPDKPEVRNSTELKGHTMPPCAVVWNPTHSDLLASCSPDGTVRFWDYRIKASLGVVATGGENIALAWHPSGETVVVATRDDKLYIITTATKTISNMHSLPTSVHSVMFSNNGETLLLSTVEGTVLFYSFPDLKPIHSIEAHASAALCMELDQRGVHLAVGGSDAVVGIWDTNEWICTRMLRGMDAPVKSVGFSFDGQFICAGSDEKDSHDIQIVHVDSGDVVHTYHTPHPVTNVKWHPHRYTLAYSGDPSGMRIILQSNDMLK
ncbi:WD40-repeat-containing domain protein [Pyronema domesticum]|nr:WD40-repeat-containing domain protein [Pyronema domesticum]